jgi:hypothetical protein
VPVSQHSAYRPQVTFQRPVRFKRYNVYISVHNRKRNRRLPAVGADINEQSVVYMAEIFKE